MGCSGRKGRKGPKIDFSLVEPDIEWRSKVALNNDLIGIETDNFHQPTDINYRGKHCIVVFFIHIY